MTNKIKIIVALVVTVVLTQPLTNQYIITGIEYALIKSVVLAPFAMVGLFAYVVFLIGEWYGRTEKVNIPSKSSKTKKQTYIPTK